MKNGNIVEIGDADKIYSNPKAEYTRLLLEAVPRPLY
jgi:ABC-type oligopeptide transport system ATPase subunit